MNVNILKPEDALSDGADLWILPSLHVSEWTRQLDWPLNLLITRAHHHSPLEIPLQLRKIAIESEMRLPVQDVGPDLPLLVSSNGRLPNRITAVIGETTPDKWVSASMKVWRDLLRPSARFFLPAFAPFEKIKLVWPRDATGENIQIVESNKDATVGERT